MVPLMNYLRNKVNTSQRAGFTIIEIFVVVGILAILSGIAIASGSRSLERSKIDAVAIELAGWLTAIRPKDGNGCFVDYVAEANPPDNVVTTVTEPSNVFASGDSLFQLRAGSSCSAPSTTFRLPGNVGGDYKLSFYAPIIFSQRGTIAIADNSTSDTGDKYIRIYRAGSGLLRCIRINYWTGIVEIGSNSAATGISDTCTSFDRV